MRYSDLVDQYREIMGFVSSPLVNNDVRRQCVEFLLSVIEAIRRVGDQIERQVTVVLEKLGPLTGL